MSGRFLWAAVAVLAATIVFSLTHTLVGFPATFRSPWIAAALVLVGFGLGDWLPERLTSKARDPAVRHLVAQAIRLATVLAGTITVVVLSPEQQRTELLLITGLDYLIALAVDATVSYRSTLV